VRDQSANGLRMLDSAIAKDPRRSILTDATYYAQLGNPSRARSLLAAYDSLPKEEYTQGTERRLPSGWILIAEGNPLNAIAEIRASQMLSDGPLVASAIAIDPDVGLAFERASLPDSAIAAYEHYLNTHQANRLNDDGFKLPWVLEHVAALYAKKGERDKARATYSRFVDLWRNADSELQPRVMHAREEIAALARATP
jgi:tetratricopeptide (TPR) repeat protein